MENETYSKSFNCRYFKNFECGTNGDDSFTARERERARESESVNLDGSQRFNKAEREREIWKCEREDRDGTV